MNNNFNTNSSFDVKMSSNRNQNFEVRTNTGTNKINTEILDGSAIIPIKTSKDVRMTIDSSSGTYLKYIIDNETGNYILLEDNVLKLFSKTGKLLSATSIPYELPAHDTVRNKYLFINSLGNLTWAEGPGEASEYYSGAAIKIDDEHKINLVYDTRALTLNAQGELTIDFDKVQEKLTAGNENVIIEGNKIYTKDTTYKAGRNITIDETTHEISALDGINDYYYLTNKPSINGVELIGRMLGKDLKLDVVEYMLYKDYLKLEPKEPKLYFVCKNTKDVEAQDCWRIYLQNKLIGEWEISSGMVTLMKFPFRFPARFC